MKPILLLIDDNAEIIEFLEDSLGADFQILKTFDPFRVEKILEKNAVNIIISDVMMPGLDGFELCKQLKNSTDWCHIPIILLTAKNSLNSRIEGLDLGADAYIEKPFSPRHLRAQIHNLLANRAIIKTYYASSPLLHIKSMANNRADELFLERLSQIIIDNLDKPNLHGEQIAELLNMSRPTLYRRIRSISNLTAAELITLTRIKKAAQLLAEGIYRISEVSNITGFSSPNHFSRTFLKQFKISPSAFVKQVMEDTSDN